MPVSGPTPEELDRAIRELRKIQERHQLDYDEQAWLDTAVGFLAAYPLPPEDGKREEIATFLEEQAEVEIRAVRSAATQGFIIAANSTHEKMARQYRRAAALLRQPVPATGVSKETPGDGELAEDL